MRVYGLEQGWTDRAAGDTGTVDTAEYLLSSGAPTPLLRSVLGLHFMKYIPDAFVELFDKPSAGVLLSTTARLPPP